MRLCDNTKRKTHSTYKVLIALSARFNIRTVDPCVVDVLERTLGVPHIVAATLVARGIESPQEAREFLNPSLERDWRNPYDIPGMAEVADGLEAAIRDGKRILVFGDFDVDGVSATTVLTRGLRALGATAIPFIPRRTDEGYGITQAAIDRFMVEEPDVVVTVDCGIACRDEVRTLKHRGVGVFITDHHEPADLVPEGVPVCDPKLDPDCPSSILAGVGVALKLVQVLGARFGQPHLWREYTDFATLGTVADLMPMQEGNRALVADGVARMNESPRPCIAALLAAAGAAGKPVAATSLSFSLIPRLNAAGRMGDATVALDLLLEDDFDAASRKAAVLEEVNTQRRAIEAELAEIASLQAKEVYHGQRALVVGGEGWHEGVKGIVASRLVRSYGVPCILFTIDDEGVARGSGRSVGQVNLFEAVESCKDILTRFGGHEAAVGVTLPADRLAEFSDRLCAYMDTLPASSFHPRIDIDAVVDLGELTLENVSALDALAPFGQENRQPRYLARDVTLTRSRAVGADKNHFSTTLTDGVHSVAGIMFHCPYIDQLMRCDSVVNAAFEVQVDEWRGRRSVKAMLSSIAPVKPCCALEALISSEHRNYVAEMYAESDSELCADCADDPEEDNRLEEERERNRAHWEAIAAERPDELRREIIAALIGDGDLFASQREVLDALARGESTLAVMATGRGKSLTFQLHAAEGALAKHEASLFVYPLRALIADQAYHVRESLAPFGIAAEVLTGESTPGERAAVFAGLEDGSVDIVLTTPEFLSFHAREFATSGRIRFLVVDEAHHIGQAKAGQRPAYIELDRAMKVLGDPCVLALTATAGPDVAGDIERTLGITRCVFDDTSRENLLVDDQRNLRHRDPYLANLVATGEKTVVYVNSRRQSVALARMLRKQVPQMAPFIGFYNAGLPRADRKRVEEMFRRGQLAVLVSTSAFGEGVNIPDIRHVVLYHLPFNEVEFNQMSGRAGRDGEKATVHLLFGAADAKVNEQILTAWTPDHDMMGEVYRTVAGMAKAQAGKAIRNTDDEIAQATASRLSRDVAPESVTCAIAVFRELGLVRTSAVPGAPEVRALSVVPAQSKVELTDSVRYREGLDEIRIFRAFCEWAMKCSPAAVRDRIIRPILPSAGN